jgi:ankyrin repeat protein
MRKFKEAWGRMWSQDDPVEELDVSGKPDECRRNIYGQTSLHFASYTDPSAPDYLHKKKRFQLLVKQGLSASLDHEGMLPQVQPWHAYYASLIPKDKRAHLFLSKSFYRRVFRLMKRDFNRLALSLPPEEVPARELAAVIDHLRSAVVEGQTRLHLAAQRGDDAFVRGWLAGAGAHYRELTAVAGEGPTPLELAYQRGDEAFVRGWLAEGDSPEALNAVDADGNTPLHLAAKEGHGAVIACLLGNDGIELFIQNRKDEQTPLHLAVQQGHAGVVAQLIFAQGRAVARLIPLKADRLEQERAHPIDDALRRELREQAIIKVKTDLRSKGLFRPKDKYGQTSLALALKNDSMPVCWPWLFSESPQIDQYVRWSLFSAEVPEPEDVHLAGMKARMFPLMLSSQVLSAVYPRAFRLREKVKVRLGWQVGRDLLEHFSAPFPNAFLHIPENSVEGSGAGLGHAPAAADVVLASAGGAALAKTPEDRPAAEDYVGPDDRFSQLNDDVMAKIFSYL